MLSLLYPQGTVNDRRFSLVKKVEERLLNDGAEDLYCLLEVMYKEQKMNFQQFIYDASRGIGSVVYEG